MRAIYHSGFWIRDEAYLRSGPQLSVNHDYFELDGRPLAVVGTTYMSSEVQRLFFEHPNVYVWNQDLAQIHDAGLNMIRTGWWTGWDKFCDENGQPYERTLAHDGSLPDDRAQVRPAGAVQFLRLPAGCARRRECVILIPQAVRRQQTLISSVVARFHDVPYLAWDLINEPSISQHLWKTRPNGDPDRTRENGIDWLSERYPDRAKLAALWNVPAGSVAGTIALPTEDEFAPRGMYAGTNSLKVIRLLPFRAGVVRAVGANHARNDSRHRLAATRHRWPGRRRHSGSPLSGLLGQVRGFHDQSFVVAKRLRPVGFAARQAARRSHADPGNRTATRIEYR